MSSRLHCSSIFTLADARTVAVNLGSSSGRRAAADEHAVPLGDDHLCYGRGSWLYVRRYPVNCSSASRRTTCSTTCAAAASATSS
jgi:hypothetical protein